MSISLDKFRAYGQQATNVDNNLRVGHFGKLREVNVGTKGRFGKLQAETTPAQNQKVRNTLLKAMRSDLKSTFGGVFKSKSKNLNWMADKLLNKVKDDARAAGQGLNGQSVTRMLTKYDSYKADLKQALASAKQLFHGKELTAHYKELQQAKPSEIRSVRTAALIKKIGTGGTVDTAALNRLHTLAEGAGAEKLKQFEKNLAAIASLDRTNPTEALRAATAEKCAAVLGRAIDAGCCDIGHLLEVQSQVLSESQTGVKFISDHLNAGVINPLPRNHTEIRAEVPKEICDLQNEKLNATRPDGTKPVPDEDLFSALRVTGADVHRGLSLTVDGERMPDPVHDGDIKGCVGETSDFFDKTIEKNMPKNLTEAQQELLKSHMKWATCVYAQQAVDTAYYNIVSDQQVNKYPFRLLPFTENSIMRTDRTYDKTVSITGKGDGNWNLHYAYHVDHMAMALPTDLSLGTDGAVFFDPTDNQNELTFEFDIRIRVALQEDGSVKTDFALDGAPKVHAVLDAMTKDEKEAKGL